MREGKLQIEQLYDAYHRDVYHFALYFTNNKQEAEDITQETFLKVLKQLNRLEDSQDYNSVIERKLRTLIEPDTAQLKGE